MSDFSDFCYCESYSDFVASEKRKAKKPHKCRECWRAIAPGETYEHARGKCEGEMFTTKTCADCLAFRDFVSAHVPCICWEYGSIHNKGIAAAKEASRIAPGTYFGAMRFLVKASQRGGKIERDGDY